MDTTGIGLRGTVGYMEYLEDAILLSTDTTWLPLTDAYNKIADTYGIKFVMQSIEPGCNVYINTDTDGIYFPDKYIINMTDEGIITPSGIRIGEKLEYGQLFTSEKGILSCFKELGYDADTLEDLQAILENTGVYIHKFKHLNYNLT